MSQRGVRILRACLFAVVASLAANSYGEILTNAAQVLSLSAERANRRFRFMLSESLRPLSQVGAESFSFRTKRAASLLQIVGSFALSRVTSSKSRARRVLAPMRR